MKDKSRKSKQGMMIEIPHSPDSSNLESFKNLIDKLASTEPRILANRFIRDRGLSPLSLEDCWIKYVRIVPNWSFD